MTSKEALLDIKKRNEALKREGHFHIGEIAMKVIEKLVERDTPKKPLLVEASADNEHRYVCLFCNATINIGSSISYNKVFNVFCRGCGQRLDWSESK